MNFSHLLKKSTVEHGVIVIYTLLLSLVSTFHEPWFDEAQAWLIARDSTLLNMLWNVLRYEGHTPLWHLILWLPAHSGLPFEPSIKTTNLIFSVLSTWLIVKKAPFPLRWRCLLPFSYFLFYQYGVINRCYALLACVLWLVAAAYPSRNRKPYVFAGLLACLGAVTAHGMLMAFGIAMAWLLEIKSERRDWTNAPNQNTKPQLSKRIYALLILAGIHGVYVLMLWPKPDKVTPLQNTEFSLQALLFKLFAMPMNSLFTDYNRTEYTAIDSTMLAMILAGMLLTTLWVLTIWVKQCRWYILIPYFTTGIFMAAIYMAKHHAGIYGLLLIFVAWIYWSEPNAPNHSSKTAHFLKRLRMVSTESPRIQRWMSILIFSVVMIQGFWTVSASINDIRYSYNSGRSIADYIRAHHLETLRIFSGYGSSNESVEYWKVDITPLAYFDNNIYYNHNNGHTQTAYSLHRQWPPTEALRYLTEAGPPDVVIQNEHSLYYYHSFLNPKDYTEVKAFFSCDIWKNKLYWRERNIFVHSELYMNNPNLKEADDDGRPTQPATASNTIRSSPF